MILPRLSGLVALLLGASALAQPRASSPQELQTAVWAASCMACHGTDGKAEGTGLTIGGRPASELLAAMLAFKQGKKSATIMHQHAKGYSDAELQRIAEYFSKLK